MNPRINNPYLSSLGTGQLAPGYPSPFQRLAQPLPVQGTMVPTPGVGPIPAQPAPSAVAPVRAVGPMRSPMPQNNLVNYGGLGTMLRSPMAR